MHPLAGKAQSAEHIAKRTAAVIAERQTWSDEKKSAWRAGISKNSRSRDPDVRRRNSDAHKGKPAWNKGNRWQDNFTPAQVRAITAERARKRRASNPRTKINGRVSALVRASLKGRLALKAGRSWTELLGYSLDELITHLRQTIPAGFTWQDYLDGALQIDHIVPVAAHNFTSTTDIDFGKCWALENLRLLSADENQAKKDKLLAPFQPSLSIS